VDIQQIAQEDQKSRLEKKLDKVPVLFPWIELMWNCDSSRVDDFRAARRHGAM
jgi:hypothetical protein